MSTLNIWERVNRDFDMFGICLETMGNGRDIVWKNRAYKVIKFEDSKKHYPFGVKLEDSNKDPLAGLFYLQAFTFFYCYYN